ncbi:hypothetical protein C1I98_06690 [Spongiactinospora gelatinilytica]|uniref:Uncharacterized protein n=1 Tax=Spongiactinospora gelatinilytica TaxID=2666298 RepID=A0A2W2GTC3_9ACTN|nr:WD40 repeat domain-containing protein [Spongiactinospora gelatinilytica]PZG52856.1 hypothetical protein C1I98_06690 [Spongiactinospora gelatinilytica]
MDGKAPDPEQARTAAEFVAGMRRLRSWSGLSYRQLAQRAAAAGRVLPHNTLAAALQRDTLPRKDLLVAFAKACGLPDEEVAAWTAARYRLSEETLRETAGETSGESPGKAAGEFYGATGEKFAGKAAWTRPGDDRKAAGSPLADVPATAGEDHEERRPAASGGFSRRDLLATAAVAGTLGAGIALAVPELLRRARATPRPRPDPTPIVGAQVSVLPHPDVVDTVAFSPHGRVLATGSLDGTVGLWEVATGRRLTVLTGHTHYVGSVVFSPDGRVLATSSFDGTVRLWDMTTMKLLTVLTGHAGPVLVRFSPDGRVLATSGHDAKVRLWDMSGRTLIALLGGHTGLAAITFSPDGHVLATNANDPMVRLWNVARARRTASLPFPEPGKSRVLFGPEGRLMRVDQGPRSVSVWDVAAGKSLTAFDVVASGTIVNDDGATGLADVVTRSLDGTVRVWPVHPGRPLSEPWVAFAGPPGQDKDLQLGRRGDVVAVCGMSGMTEPWKADTRVWLGDIYTKRHLTTLAGHTGRIRALAFSPRRDLVATASVDRTARLWRIRKL